MKKLLVYVSIVFAMFMLSGCESTEINDEINLDINATDKDDTSSPGSGGSGDGGDDDDVY